MTMVLGSDHLEEVGVREDEPPSVVSYGFTARLVRALSVGCPDPLRVGQGCPPQRDQGPSIPSGERGSNRRNWTLEHSPPVSSGDIWLMSTPSQRIAAGRYAPGVGDRPASKSRDTEAAGAISSTAVSAVSPVATLTVRA